MALEFGFDLLSERECRALLEAEWFGRVAISVGALPAIFPVNYRMLGGDVLFHSAEVLRYRSALDGNVVGFEVDHMEASQHRGWSVMVLGVAREMSGPEAEQARSGQGSLWDGGGSHHLVRLHPELISGRLILWP